MREAGRRFFSALAALSLGALLALALVEGVLRLRGERPWQYRRFHAGIPATNRPDPVLGWVAKPGRYDIPPFSPEGRRTHLTVLPDGSRATGSHPRPGGRALLLVGGSFTFGWAVSDEDTFAWRLAQIFPGSEVRNYGVSGYGTYQSLLELERLFAAGAAPDRVLYGYLDGHEFRNVAHPLWLFGLTKYSTQGMVLLPYALPDAGGGLRRMPPTRYPDWPLKGRLALVNFLERQYVWWTQHQRTDAALAAAVTDRILADMARLCAAHAAAFDMVLLHATDEKKEHYRRLLPTLGATAIDCSRPLTAEYTVRGDGHPNPKLHGLWADCIAAALTAPGGE